MAGRESAATDPGGAGLGRRRLAGPVVAEVRQQPLKQAALLARGLDEPVVMWGLVMPSFTVYRGQVTPQRRPQPGEAVVKLPLPERPSCSSKIPGVPAKPLPMRMM